MEKQPKLTLIGFIVIFLTVIFLMAIIMPQFGRVKQIAQRVVCGTNLKGLGTAMTLYSNHYDGDFVRLGKGFWSKNLGYSYADADFNPYDFEGSSTISSSLYLLVRETDVSPKSFVCPSSDQMEFDGRNSMNLDVVELWDFGTNTYYSVNYAYH